MRDVEENTKGYIKQIIRKTKHGTEQSNRKYPGKQTYRTG